MNHEATGKAYLECIRMLNDFEKTLERHPPRQECRWAVAEAADEYGKSQELRPSGWLPNTEPRTLNTE